MRSVDISPARCDHEWLVPVEADHAIGAAIGGLSAYFSAALDCVILADASGRVLEFNPAAERTFGYSRDQALGRTLPELIVPPALRERHRRSFERFVKTRDQKVFGQRLELIGMRADGSEFPVELVLSQVEGEPLVICGALRDLSDAKRREDDLRTLADEQAALRRVATLVARQPAPAEVFAAVAEEAASLLSSPLVSMVRYEPDGTATVIAAVDEHPFPLGSNLTLDGPSIVGSVLQTRSPARVDDYARIPGGIAERIRKAGIHSAVGVPITVEGAIWGAMVAVAPGTQPLPEGTELRLANFTELVAAAIANAQARESLRMLADEQAALRKVATLAARGATPDEVFAAVAEQVAHLLQVPAINMVRFEPDGSSTAIAAWGSENPFWAGATFEPYPGVMSQVRHTGRPARLEDYAHSTGPTTARLEAAGIRSGVGVPIVVDGEVWGATIVLATGGASLPDGIEARLTSFTDLVAIAISNIQARDDLHSLADEQAALRRLAMLVAGGADSVTVFNAVCKETGRLFGASSVNLVRFTLDGFTQTAAGWSLRDLHVPTGTRLPVGENSIAALIQRTAAPSRSGLTTSEDRFRRLVEQLPLVTYVRGLGVLESNAYVSPQVEDMLGYSVQEWESDPALLERVVHPEDRDRVIAEASRVRETGDPFRLEYRMVARDGHEVWVYDEMHLVRDADEHPRGVLGVLLDVSEKKAAETAGGSAQDAFAESERRLRSIVETANEWIWAEDGRGHLTYTNPAVYEMLGYTYEGGAGELAVLLRQRGIRSEVGAPVIVDGRVWGALIAGTDEAEPLPLGTEQRLASFTELVTMAISRIQARDDLRDLAEEQAALRRVATLVAQGAARADVFAAVAQEVAGVLDLELVELARYDPEEVATVLGCFGEHAFQVGTSWPLEGGSLTARVWRSGQPERIDDYRNLAGVTAQAAFESGVRAGVAVPIVVDGMTWGVIAAGSTSDPVPAGTEERLTDFTELVATAVLNTQARQDLQQLVAEQASLRHVATLVALETPPEELFAAVAEEVARFVDVPVIGIARYEADGTATAMGSWGPIPFPAGESLAPHPGAIADVRRTGLPAEIPSYAELGNEISVRLVEAGIQSGLGVPIEVGGRLWGVMLALSTADKPLPEGLQGRLAVFTELVATAISNAEARNDLRRLAAQQAALRRVATLVAERTTPEALFAAVADEVNSVLGFPTMLVRLDPDGFSTEVAESGGVNPYPFGTTFPPHPGVIAMVRASGRPERVDDYAEIPGEDAAFVRASGIRSSVGAPITVDGRTWGLAIVLSEEPLPAGTEARLLEFTELVATAISNTQARADLNRLLNEQAALRRVATVVAKAAPPTEVFATVAEEVEGHLDVDVVNIVRHEVDNTATAVASWSRIGGTIPIGTRLPLDGPSLMGTVSRTGRPARIDSYADVPNAITYTVDGVAINAGVGVPINVDGRVWGTVIALTTQPTLLPADTERRLADFTELIATAISNTQARDDLRGLGDEQAALRRLATQVAQGADPHDVFATVCEETGRLLAATSTNLAHFTADGFNLTMAGWSLRDTHVPTGTRLPLGADTINDLIQHTVAPARFDSYADGAGPLAELIRERGIRSEVGAPVIVDGQVWGALIAGSDRAEPLPSGAELRVARFAELIATAVSNATTRSELIASRARIVAASDDARRRIERNLHDGTQQRLLAIGLDLQALRAGIPAELPDSRTALHRIERDVEQVLDDVRELSRGLHPALLSQGGLRLSLKALARRSPIHVTLSVSLEARPPEPIEIAVYYVVAEALTNAAKHSSASEISVTVASVEAMLQATIEDDGRGGAEPTAGSGLLGLIDRVEALGGRFVLHSPSGRGTKISIELPLVAPVTDVALGTATTPPALNEQQP
jgi:PAS domain S-box-containing protein